MKTIISNIITALIAVFVGIFIGMNLHTDNLTKKSQKQEHISKPVIKKVNETRENNNWKITLKTISTRKVETKKKEYSYFIPGNDKLLDERHNWYYRTVITAIFENKSDRDISSSASDGHLTLIDGDGNTRTNFGATLNSYVDISPNSVINFPSKSKTTVTFVVISNKPDFNAKGLRILIPTYYSRDDMTDPFNGGTFEFSN
ncbi:hypothetical protein LK472_06600 [Leuconostoc lactis]|uniref:hypothetical protein n=1 Tax=Leuconostoc lactis TaxID=1246 RepID=UPI001D10EDA9|nr:hypothetical protein [Leuconostoc lactis]MCC2745077.1 hypothetical protein [Leuconostoc lactis]MCC2755614.1 hypothetical protein [Leuconostoc lactis]